MYEDTRLTIANYLQANWTYCPLFAENIGETQPPDVMFSRYTIRPIDAVSLSVGATNQYSRRERAYLWFQFFDVEGKGSTNAMKFGDAVVVLFDQKWLTTPANKLIIFKRSLLTSVGIEPSGRPHWKCTIEYHVDML